MKKLIAIVSAVVFLALLGAVLTPGARSQQFAPSFTVKDLKGNSISLSDYRGKVLFLNFWATWCPPCRDEIPDFVEVYKEQKANGLEILGISLDTKGKDAVAGFVQSYGINYPVVLESRSTTQQLINDFQPGQYIPVTFIIDKQGQIRQKYVGPLDRNLLLRYFNQLAAE